MKKIIALLIILITGIRSFSQECGFSDWPLAYVNSIGDCDNYESGDWILVFSDEFDDYEIDQSKWYTCFGGWLRGDGDAEQYYLDENIVLENGKAKLTAKREPGYYDIWKWDEDGNAYLDSEYFEYTSAHIEPKMRFEYGLFEIRCKIPYGKGFWPAFWLWGYDDIEDISPEIDVFEFVGNEPDDHHMNIRKWVDGDVSDCANVEDYDINFSAGFHTFSLEWDEFKIIYRVDGDLVRIDLRRVSEDYFDFIYDCQDFYPYYYMHNPLFPTNNATASVILNLAISNGSYGDPPDASTIFPSALEIEYIHIFRKRNPTRDVSICSYDYYANESNAITGRTISIGGTSCNPAIENNRSISLFATDNIRLLKGFHAKQGSTFSAQIIDGSLKSEMVLNDNHLNEQLITSELSTVLIEEQYMIYPNPNAGSFNISGLDIYKNARLEIFDMMGKLIYSKMNCMDEEIVNISDQPNGIYLVRIISDGQVTTRQIVKQ